MNNKELFINGFLERIANQYPQSTNPKNNIDLAFEIFAIAAALDKPFQEVFDNILIKDKTGKKSGNLDGGIDGIWFNDLGDYFEMKVFQCKNSYSLKDNEINKFRNDVKDIFVDGNKVGKEKIDDLEPYINDYVSISQSGKIIEIKLYFIFNGNIVDSQYTNNESAYGIYNNPDSYFWIYDSNWIYGKLASFSKNYRNKVEFVFHPENSNFAIQDNQALYTYSIGNTRAANFRVYATEICELIEKEISVNGTFDLLFEENIRQYLGASKFRANRKMNETLNSEDAVLFPFLNNGITIVSEQMTVPRNAQNGEYVLPVINPQIVNGLQTSRVLFEIYKDEKKRENLKGVFVNVRVYESKENGLIEKITDATNTQTPITNKDKISNKDFNELAKAVFANNGIDYITKRGEGFGTTSIPYSKQVESETIIKFWFATLYEKPETAKNSIAGVLQEIYDASTLEKHPLEFLFNGNPDSPIYRQFITAFEIYKYIQANKTKYLSEYELVAYADEMIAYGIYKFIGTDLQDYADETRLKSAYEDTLATIDKCVAKNKKEIEEKEKTFSLNGYFKKSKCRYDFNEVKGIIESDTLIDDLKKIS
ncbi:MAG: AIPR family protein [Ginsengibacter sp.]